ncbi:MAG: hypothetical protein ACFFGZ_17505 [Candidatus Thorarchaeota archaeon]
MIRRFQTTTIADLIPIYINPGEITHLEQFLRSRGFAGTVRYTPEPGQAWYLTRNIGPSQLAGYPDTLWHIHAFEEGRIEAKIAILDEDLQYLAGEGISGHEGLSYFFSIRGIPHRIGSNEGVRIHPSEALQKRFEEKWPSWRDFLLLLGLSAGLVGVTYFKPEL